MGDSSPVAPRHEGTHPQPDNAPYEIGDVVSPFSSSDVEVTVTGRSWDSASNEWKYTGLSLPREVNGKLIPGGRTFSWQEAGPIHTTPTTPTTPGGPSEPSEPTYTDHTVAPPGFTQEEWDRISPTSQRQYYQSGGSEFWTDILHYEVDYGIAQERGEQAEDRRQRAEALVRSDQPDIDAVLAILKESTAAQDIDLLRWLFEQDALTEIGITSREQDGSTRQLTIGEYIGEYLADHETRQRVNAVLAEVRDITAEANAEDIPALQSIASDPDKANLTIILNDADGQPVETTIGKYLSEMVIPQTQERVKTNTALSKVDAILSTTDEGDVAALQALADDPATGALPIMVTGPDGEPVQTTVGDYITNTLIPQVQRNTYTGDDITPENAHHAWNRQADDRQAALDTLSNPDATPEELEGAATALNGLADAYADSGFTLQVDHDHNPDTPPEAVPASDWLRKAAGLATARIAGIYTGDNITGPNAPAAWNSNLDTVNEALIPSTTPTPPRRNSRSGRHAERPGRRLRRQRL